VAADIRRAEAVILFQEESGGVKRGKIGSWACSGGMWMTYRTVISRFALRNGGVRPSYVFSGVCFAGCAPTWVAR
jgi:hypothetical protein